MIVQVTPALIPDNEPSFATLRRPLRLACFVSHPIQYQAPLFRRIAQEADIDLKVFFSSDCSVRGYHDSGFGMRVQWDIPLLEGYASEFLPRIGDKDRIGFAQPLNWGVVSRLQKGRFDVVWVMGYSRLVFLNAIYGAGLLRIPVLVRACTSLIHRVRSKRILAAKRLFMSLLKPAVSGVLSIGQDNTAFWKHWLGSDIPIFNMPYAVDNDYFRGQILRAAPMRENLRAELGLEGDRPIILFVSKLIPGKRCIDLVEAYIRTQGDPRGLPSAYLLIAGAGEERPHLEQRVQSSGCRGIRFLGFQNQSQLPRLYDLCDVFVLPSAHDTWGLVVNEAMNAGKPVIVTDRVGCYPDLVHDGVNGFVYPASNIDALTNSLVRLLENPELRKSMGENSLRFIQQYSFEQDVASLRLALTHMVPGFEPGTAS